MRQLTYFIATSLDGFIAGPDGRFDGFPQEGDHIQAIVAEYPDTLPTHVHEMVGVNPTGGRFDTVLMGWNTYAVGLAEGVDSPYSHLRQVVFSSQARTVPPDVRLESGNPVEFARRLKAEPSGTGIWLCGGGSLATALADEIDELVLKVNPVLFGSGIPLFGNRAYRPDRFERVSIEPVDSGVTFMSYRRIT